MPARERIAFIGAGNMAEALIAGLLHTGRTDPARLVAADVLAARLDLLKRTYGIGTTGVNRDAIRNADVVVLAVEPQVLDDVLIDIAPSFTPSHLVVSVAAGYPIARISRYAPGATRIVRAMPNTPATIRQGITALAHRPDLSDTDARTGRELFESVGKVVVVEERLMDVVTALSGGGPAYVCVIIEALADGGVKMGLPRAVAQTLAAQTVAGAARMVLESADHPAALKDRVASPGGTTIAGLHALEEGRVRAALVSAVEAATNRAKELGREDARE